MSQIFKLLEFLQGKSFEEIEAELSSEPYFVKVKRLGDLYLLSYDQIKTPTNIPMLWACRGVIFKIEEGNVHRVVCMSFQRFFNYHEGEKASIDWESPKLEIQEKVDGSLVRFWIDSQKELRISSRGTIDADTAVLPTPGNTVGSLVREVLTEEQKQWLITECKKGRTVVCELWHPGNSVVCTYKQPGLWLLAIFDTLELKEIEIDVPKGLFFQPESQPIQTLSQISGQLEISDQREEDLEGYVIFDGINRMKIKSLRYVTRHKIAFTKAKNLTDDDIVRAFLLEVADDIPGIDEKVEIWRQKYVRLNQFLEKELSFLKEEFNGVIADYCRKFPRRGKLAGVLKKLLCAMPLSQILLEKFPAGTLTTLLAIFE